MLPCPYHWPYEDFHVFLGSAALSEVNLLNLTFPPPFLYLPSCTVGILDGAPVGG